MLDLDERVEAFRRHYETSESHWGRHSGGGSLPYWNIDYRSFIERFIVLNDIELSSISAAATGNSLASSTSPASDISSTCVRPKMPRPACRCPECADADAAITRGVQIINSRLGISRLSGLYSEARDVQLTNLQFASTSVAGKQQAPVIRIAKRSEDTILVNIRCEEFGGRALASYCVQVDEGAARVQALAISAHYVQPGAIWGTLDGQSR